MTTRQATRRKNKDILRDQFRGRFLEVNAVAGGARRTSTTITTTGAGQKSVLTALGLHVWLIYPHGQLAGP